mgnify:CR=1 FL=1
MVKYFNQLKTELKDKSRDEIIEALDVAYQLLDDRDRLFEVIPECPEHGPKCTPYAIEWIKSKLDESGKVSNAKFNITGNFDGNTYAEIILLPGYIYRTSKIIKIEITSLKEIEPGMIVPKEGHGLLEIYIHKLNEPYGKPNIILHHNNTVRSEKTSCYHMLINSGSCITLKMSDMDRRLFIVDFTLETVI